MLVIFAPFPVKLAAVTIPEKVALPFALIVAATPILIPPVAVTTPALTANKVDPAQLRNIESLTLVVPMLTLSKR